MSFLPPRFRLHVGLVVIAAAAILAVLVLFNGDSEQTLKSYYIEAHVTVEPPTALGEHPIDMLKAWYNAPDKWRQEFSYNDPALSYMTAVQISDGKKRWGYDGRTNTYYEQALTPEQRRFAGTFAASFAMGLLPANSIDDLVSGRPDVRSHAIRNDRLLGRDVKILTLETNNGSQEEYWVDSEFVFVLRYEMRAGSQAPVRHIRAEVTELRYNQHVDAAQFRFEPPIDARQVEPQTGPISGQQSSAAIGGREISVPPGFLRPSYLPEGFVSIRSSSTSAVSGMTTATETTLQPVNQRGEVAPYLLIEQQYRAGGLPDPLTTGTPTSIGLDPAYQTQEGSVRRLVSYRGEIILRLSSDTLSFEELRRIGESMR